MPTIIVHFFILIALIVFLTTVVYALFSIVFKYEVKPFSRLIGIFKREKHIQPIFFLVVFFFLFLILYGLSRTNLFNKVYNLISSNGEAIGGIGDFFNGLVTPAVSIISIIYLWKAFVQQYKANQMLYGFEIERSFKDDIDWLRNNSPAVEKLELDIKQKDNAEIKAYIESDENVLIRKCNYILNVLQNVDNQLQKKTTEDHPLNDIKSEVQLIIESLYLPSLKNIFRIFGSYTQSLISVLKEDLADEDIKIDLGKIEIQFLIHFIDFYENANINPDKLFEGTYNSTKKLFYE